MSHPQPYWWDDDERSGCARALRYIGLIITNDYCDLFSNFGYNFDERVAARTRYAKHLAAAVRAPPDEESEILEVVKEGMNLELEPDQDDNCVLEVDSKNNENRFELAHQVTYSQPTSPTYTLQPCSESNNICSISLSP